MNRDNDTYRTVADRHKGWSDANPRPRSRSALSNFRIPQPDDNVEKAIGTALGFGVGAFLLLLAAVTFTASRSWGAIDRSGAAVAYAIATFFLLLGGLGGIAATANHLFKVIPGEAPHHH